MHVGPGWLQFPELWQITEPDASPSHENEAMVPTEYPLLAYPLSDNKDVL